VKYLGRERGMLTAVLRSVDGRGAVPFFAKLHHANPERCIFYHAHPEI